MTDYYWGIAIGGMMGYVLSLLTMLVIWALCVIAKQEEGKEDARKADTYEK